MDETGEVILMKLSLRRDNPEHVEIVAWYDSLEETEGGRKRYRPHLITALRRYIRDLGRGGSGARMTEREQGRRRGAAPATGKRADPAPVRKSPPAGKVAPPPEEPLTRATQAKDDKEDLSPDALEEYRRMMPGLTIGPEDGPEGAPKKGTEVGP